MKNLKRTILAACLFAAAGAASATAFSVTNAAFTNVGSGYGIDASENSGTATLLDIRFTNTGFTAPNFNLTTVGQFFEFIVGTVSFQESNNSGGITGNETNDLGVSLALNFAAPGVVTNTLVASGSAIAGSIQDNAFDYTLTWSPLLATFGTGGMYTITFASLAFDDISTQNLTARVTLTALPGAPIPEPDSIALLAIGLLGAGVLRSRVAKK